MESSEKTTYFIETHYWIHIIILISSNMLPTSNHIPTEPKHSLVKDCGYRILGFFAAFALFMFILDNYGAPVNLNAIQPKSQALQRHQKLLAANEVIGPKMKELHDGTMSMEDIMQPQGLHGGDNAGTSQSDGSNPMPIEEVMEFLDGFISELHQRFIGHTDKVTGEFISHKKYDFVQIWELFHDFALEKLYPWDREYLSRMPVRRDDGSIFLSIATYRDENCINTITGAFKMSHDPTLLNVGLIQQNCVEEPCRSGILDKTGKMVDVPPDDDCHKSFCESKFGKPHCEAGRVRAIHIKEPESLGPYFARYLASKLWFGESWFMQVSVG